MTGASVRSVQLYSLRDHLADLDATLERLATAGAQAVEPFWILDRPEDLAAALERHGLSAPTAHAPFLSDEIEFDGHLVPMPPADEMFEAACRLGVDIVVDPLVPPDRWKTADDVARTAERLNDAAETAAGVGLRVGYHNHTFEFRASIDGTTAYEYFASLLDDRVVLELDMFWAAAASQDVPTLVRRLGPRVRALHVKDGVVDHDPFEHGLDHDPTALDQRPAGQGALGVEEILEAATFREYDVVEFDHVEDDVFAAIDESLRFLIERAERSRPTP